MKIKSTILLLLLACTLPVSALNGTDITSKSGSIDSIQSDSDEQISLHFTLTGPKGCALLIEKDQSFKATFTAEDGSTSTQTGELSAFFSKPAMGKINVLDARVAFPSIKGTKSILLKDSIKILATDKVVTSQAETIDVAAGGSITIEGIKIDFSQASGFNNTKGIKLEYAADGAIQIGEFKFYDAAGKELKHSMYSKSGGPRNSTEMYYFHDDKLPQKIAVTCYKDLKELDVALNLTFNPSASGGSSISFSDAPMPESAPLEPLDMSEMTPAQQKMLYTMSAYMLLGQAKLTELDKLEDLGAMMSVLATVFEKGNSPELPKDYQAYLKAMNKICTELAAQLKGNDSPEAMMSAMMSAMPKMEALKSKYAEVDEFFTKSSLSSDGGSGDVFKDICIVFGLEKQMNAYVKKLKAEGLSDEKELQIKSMRAAANFLNKKAKAIK